MKPHRFTTEVWRQSVDGPRIELVVCCDGTTSIECYSKGEKVIAYIDLDDLDVLIDNLTRTRERAMQFAAASGDQRPPGWMVASSK